MRILKSSGIPRKIGNIQLFDSKISKQIIPDYVGCDRSAAVLKQVFCIQKLKCFEYLRLVEATIQILTAQKSEMKSAE